MIFFLKPISEILCPKVWKCIHTPFLSLVCCYLVTSCKVNLKGSFFSLLPCSRSPPLFLTQECYENNRQLFIYSILPSRDFSQFLLWHTLTDYGAKLVDFWQSVLKREWGFKIFFFGSKAEHMLCMQKIPNLIPGISIYLRWQILETGTARNHGESLWDGVDYATPKASYALSPTKLIYAKILTSPGVTFNP